MRIIRILAVFLAVLLAACADDALGTHAPYGTWLRRTEGVSPLEQRWQEWQREEQRLTLRPDGSYTSDTRTWAVWEGSAGKLLGYATTHGTYEMQGDSLFLTISRTETWSHASGGPPRVHEEAHAGPRYRARVSRFRLVLEFVHFPRHVPENGEVTYLKIN